MKFKLNQLILSFVIFLFSFTQSKCQISIFYNALNPLTISQGDVFNVSIILNPNIPIQEKYKLRGLIIESQKGALIQAVTQEFTLNTGNNNIPTLNLSISYTSLSQMVKASGFLPYGKYRLECQLTNIYDEPVSYCETEIDLVPLTPPQLAFPDDNATIESTLPTLFWIPPFPIPSSGIVYNLQLAEILNNQSSNEALSLNLPILNLNINDQNSYQYTPNNLPLYTGKSYAWQVSAKDKTGILIGVTEIWQFKLEKDLKTRKTDSSYIVINSENLKRTFKTDDKQLFLKFEENYKSGNFEYIIKNLKGEIIDCAINTKKMPGENRMVLNFGDCNELESGSIYFIELKLNKSDRFLLRTLID